jgi:hypothetical protein
MSVDSSAMSHLATLNVTLLCVKRRSDFMSEYREGEAPAAPGLVAVSARRDPHGPLLGPLSQGTLARRLRLCDFRQRGFFLVSRLLLVFFFVTAADFFEVLVLVLADFLAVTFFWGAFFLSLDFPDLSLSFFVVFAATAFLLVRFGKRSLASGAISSRMPRTRGEKGAAW